MSAPQTLVRCFEPCLVGVLGILDAAMTEIMEQGMDVSALRDSIMAGLDEAVLAASVNFSTQTTVLARRFVTAWTDERLAGGDWPGRDAWRAHPLQSDWGEGRTAGEWFFEALERLDPARVDDAALAALALRCLALTFDGRMHRSQQELLDLRRATARRFNLLCPPASFPPSPRPDALPVRRIGAWRWWLLPMAAAVLLAAACWFAEGHLDEHLESRMPPTAAY